MKVCVFILMMSSCGSSSVIFEDVNPNFPCPVTSWAYNIYPSRLIGRKNLISHLLPKWGWRTDCDLPNRKRMESRWTQNNDSHQKVPRESLFLSQENTHAVVISMGQTENYVVCWFFTSCSYNETMSPNITIPRIGILRDDFLGMLTSEFV